MKPLLHIVPLPDFLAGPAGIVFHPQAADEVRACVEVDPEWLWLGQPKVAYHLLGYHVLSTDSACPEVGTGGDAHESKGFLPMTPLKTEATA